MSHNTAQPRSIKSILVAFRDQVEREGLTSLCHKTWDFAGTPAERKILQRYLGNNAPFNWYRLFSRTGYWWRPGLQDPRLKWLNKKIKNLR